MSLGENDLQFGGQGAHLAVQQSLMEFLDEFTEVISGELRVLDRELSEEF